MTKTYIAFYDDGHDFGEFEFESEHRARSAANLADAVKEAKRKYGYKRARCIRIRQTQLAE